MPTLDDIFQRAMARPPHERQMPPEDYQALDKKIVGLFASISTCDSAADADSHLVEFGHLQDLMAALAFRFGTQLTERQREIVREYDRWDVPEIRKRAFEKIKAGEFPSVLHSGG